MKLGNFKRIYKNDYSEEQQGLIERLSVSLNIGIESLYDALNRKLNLTDNLATTVRDVTVIVDSNGLPVSRTSFSLDLTTPVLGTQVIRAENQDDGNIYPSNGVFLNFTQSSGNVIINHITGLQAGYTYRLKVIAWHS